jgi:hypothetical protein
MVTTSVAFIGMIVTFVDGWALGFTISVKGVIAFLSERMVDKCNICGIRPGRCLVVKWHLDYHNKKATYQTYCEPCENYYTTLPDDKPPPWANKDSQ